MTPLDAQELIDAIDQLRLHGMEVVWTTALPDPLMWAEEQHLVTLSAVHDHHQVTQGCIALLREVAPSA